MDEMTSLSPRNSRIAGELVNLTTQVTMGAVQACDGDNKAESAFVAAMGVIGAMHVLASVVGNAERAEKPQDAVTPTSSLFAALLAHQICPTVNHDGRAKAEFGPHVVFHVMGLVEKLIGRRPDDFLDRVMCKQIREVMESEEARQELEKLIAKRKFEAFNSRSDLPKHFN